MLLEALACLLNVTAFLRRPRGFHILKFLKIDISRSFYNFCSSSSHSFIGMKECCPSVK